MTSGPCSVKKSGGGELGGPALKWNVFLNAEIAEGTEKKMRERLIHSDDA